MDESTGPADPTSEPLARKLSFYERLVALNAHQRPGPLLEEALGLITEVSGARQGYLELGDALGPGDAARWSMAHGGLATDGDGLASVVSRGIVAQALASKETILTTCALADPRFEERESVQTHGIEAVLCTAVGAEPPVGFVYLQGRQAPGPFTDADVERLELFALQIAPLAERLVLRRQADAAEDFLQPYRETLQLDGVVGRSRALADVVGRLRPFTQLDVPLLLTGPSGTGKTLLARVVHDNSGRRDGPFVPVNCTAFSRDLVEAELFGVRRGAYTGATETRVGKVGAAEGGTLFLDEIGDVPADVQVKLLMFLDSRSYFRVGDDKLRVADVRLICATNRNLREGVAQGTFREDLWYRVDRFQVRMPALSERPEDVPLLADELCAAACREHGLARVRLSHGARLWLAEREWPGNVRELGSAVLAAAVLAASEGASLVEPRHLRSPGADHVRDDVEGPTTFRGATEAFQRRLLCATLEDANWNVSETARRLELSRSHLYELMNGFSLRREDV